MKMLVAGGFDPEGARADEIRLLCRAVGRAIVVHGHTLYTGARSELDALVAEAASETLEGSSQEARSQRIISYCLAGENPIHGYGNMRISRLENWELGNWPYHVPERVDYADVVVLIAGSTGTNRTANWARIAGKPALPFATFGGSAAKIYVDELNDFEQRHRGRLDRGDFEQLNTVKGPAAHATDIVALAEKIAQSWSVVAVMSYDNRPDLQDLYVTFQRVCGDLGYTCEHISEKSTVTRIIPEIFGTYPPGRVQHCRPYWLET